MEPINKEDLTRNTVLGIATENAILHAAVSQWQLGHLTWEEALISAIWAMNGRTKQLEGMFLEGLAATMPKMEVTMTRADFESFLSQNRLTIAAPDLLATCEALDDFQKQYEANAWDKMPGNDLYAPWLMRIVEQARAAIAKTKGQ